MKKTLTLFLLVLLIIAIVAFIVVNNFYQNNKMWIDFALANIKW